MRCPTCQHENADAARFCEACGAKLARTCGACGQEVGRQARFCSACGASLAEARDRHDSVPLAEEPPLAQQGLRHAGGRRDRTWALLSSYDLQRRHAEDPEGSGPTANSVPAFS